MNFFTDNDDLQFHFRERVDWGSFVPLWEEGFRFEDGPRSLEEARELYGDVLGEVGEYAAREIAPRAREIDEQGVGFRDGQVVHPPALLRNIEGLKRLGVMGVNLPRDLGGSNFPITVGAALGEILSRACTNTFLLHVFHQAPAVPIVRFGTREQAQAWVPGLASGAISGAVAMTEPEAGSDVGNLSTTAVPEDGHGSAAPIGSRGWRLTGRKQFITNGCGDVCVVLARTEPGTKGLDGLSLLLCPRMENGRENYRVARPERKMVIRGSATCELSFEGSCAELLGPRGAGFAEILTFMNEARIAVAIQGLGIAEAATRAARAYAATRVQMGRPIARHEMVADMLLDMEAETAALRALVLRCVGLQDRILGLERRPGAPAAELARLKRALRDRTPLVKWFGSERVLWIARTAVQVHGGYGVVQDYDVERHYRDALILPIYEGTSQIQALMSLKDQARWLLEKPWRLLTGAVAVEAGADVLGDGVRDLALEYGRTLRHVLARSVGLGRIVSMLAGRGRGGAAAEDDLAPARRHAERLTAMLAYTRAAEALASHARASARHRALAERFVSRALPLVRMHGEIVRQGDPASLEAAPA